MDVALKNNGQPGVDYSAMNSLWEAVDLCLLRDGIVSSVADQRPSFSDTKDGGRSVRSELENAPDGEKIREENEDDESVELLSISVDATLCKNNGTCEQNCSNGDSESESEEGEEESDDEGIEGDEESDDEGIEEDEEDSDEDESLEYKKDLFDTEESLSDRNDDASSLYSAAYPTNNGQSQHEMFLPHGISPSVEPLKYEDEYGETQREEEDAPSSCYSRNTSMNGNGLNSHPRMLDGCPPCVSTSSESSSEELLSCDKFKNKAQNKRGGISFSNSVTVYPIFDIDAYPAAVIQKMYAGRKEIRQNRIRNQREYAHDKHDWRKATEEEDMVSDDEGELFHPASQPTRPKRSVIQIHPPKEMRDEARSQAGCRGKRMRMWHSGF